MLAPVRIDGHELQPRDEIHQRKLEALRVFVQHLLASPARDQIAKIVLFGSVARGETDAESDVDVLVFGSAPLQRTDEAASDAAYAAQLDLGVYIEPFTRTCTAYEQPRGDFLLRVLREGKEVYSVDEEKLAFQTAESLYHLALKYGEQARLKYDPQSEGARRVAIDMAYNASELCAKGMLRFLTAQLPKTHSGLNTLFSDKFVKTKIAPITLGRDFAVGVRYRNESRYDGDATITPEMVQEVFSLLDQMLELLGQKLNRESQKHEQENDPRH